MQESRRKRLTEICALFAIFSLVSGLIASISGEKMWIMWGRPGLIVSGLFFVFLVALNPAKLMAVLRNGFTTSILLCGILYANMFGQKLIIAILAVPFTAAAICLTLRFLKWARNEFRAGEI